MTRLFTDAHIANVFTSETPMKGLEGDMMTNVAFNRKGTPPHNHLSLFLFC